MPSNPPTIFNTGFYNRVLNTNGPTARDVWDSISTAGGTLSVSSTVVRRAGAFSLDLDKNNPAVSTINAVKNLDIVMNSLAIRFYILFQKLQATSSRFISFTTVDSNQSFRFAFTNNTINGAWSNGSLVNSTTSIVTGTWYRMDIAIDPSSSNFNVQWMINGISQPNVTATGTVTKITTITLGASSSVTGSFRYNISDFIAASGTSSYPIGEGYSYALLPNSVITGSWLTPTNFQNNDTTAIDENSWQRLDEWPPTTGSNSDYIKQVTIMGTGYIPFGMQTRQDSGQGIINGVEAFVGYTSSGTTANTGAALIRRLDGNQVGVLGSLVTGRADMSDGSVNDWWFGMVQVDKPDAQVWSTNEINNLQFRLGYSNDVSPQPFWGALLLEYDVSVPSPYRARVMG